MAPSLVLSVAGLSAAIVCVVITAVHNESDEHIGFAKVTRDRVMEHWDKVYPEYGFAVHKGYCTPEHQAALDQYGPCPQHRRRFENVRRSLRPDMGQNVTSPTGVESR